MKACFVVPAFNGGDTSRGVEIARALRALAVKEGRALDITFLSPRVPEPHHGELVTRAGFPLEHGTLSMSGREIRELMEADHRGGELMKSPARTRDLLATMKESLDALDPDVVVYGFFPHAALAARMSGRLRVSFLPFPLHRPWMQASLPSSFPDMLVNPLTLALPEGARKSLTRAAARMMFRQPFLSQPRLARAARDLGWNDALPGLPEMMEAHRELVNDLPHLYRDQDAGPRTVLTGPVFHGAAGAAVDARLPAGLEAQIRQIMQPGPQPRFFLTMGTSGELSCLVEALKALGDRDARGVALIPPGLARPEDLARVAGTGKNLLVLDRFVPALPLHALADVSLIHGGHGTVQSAMVSGVPVLGTGMQVEQCRNLDMAVAAGTGIRIPKPLWKAREINRNLDLLTRDRSFADRARELARTCSAHDGPGTSARTILELLDQGHAKH